MIQQQVEMINASLSSAESAASMAREVQARINAANAQGWECVGISNVQATVAGEVGCAGIGAKMPYTHSVCMLLFRRHV